MLIRAGNHPPERMGWTKLASHWEPNSALPAPMSLGEAFVVSVSPSAIVILPGYSSAALLLIQFSVPDSEEIAV
jgi:hypothetical protein